VPALTEEQRAAYRARVDRLRAIGPGRPIRASDWSDLVGIVDTLLGAIPATTAATTVAPHDHAEEVTVAWLDARLRSLVERGSLADPAATQRLEAIERRVDAIAASLQSVDDRIDVVGAQVVPLVTDDRVRRAEVNSVALKVQSMTDARESVTQLRTSLDQIRTEVRRAIDVGTQFDDVRTRVAALDDFREALSGPSGDLLDRSAVASMIQAATAGLVTTDDLGVAIASIPPAVIDDARFEQLGSRVLEDVTPKLDQLRIDTTTTIDTRLATVDARIADGLRASIGPVAEELRTSLTTAVATPLASRLSQLEGAVATSQESFDQLTGRLQTLNTFTREQLAVIDVDRLRLDTELRRIDTESSGLVERIGSLREELVVINPDVIHRIPVFERFRPPHQ
jgi:hypothetical protein